MKYGFVNRVFSTDDLEREALAYAERVADNYLRDPSWYRMTKFSINHMQDAMGFSSEIEAAYNNYMVMVGVMNPEIPTPADGGFARTKIARKNLEASRPGSIPRPDHAGAQPYLKILISEITTAPEARPATVSHPPSSPCGAVPLPAASSDRPGSSLWRRDWSPILVLQRLEVIPILPKGIDRGIGGVRAVMAGRAGQQVEIVQAQAV